MATKSVWDHVNHILSVQDTDYYDTLEPPERKTFTVYMINRFISMNLDYLQTVNALQRYYGVIPDRLVYKLYANIFPKRKVFSKYIKAVKEDAYEPWMIDVLVKEYQISRIEAIAYLDILHKSADGLTDLRLLCQDHGVDAKLIKKIK